MYGRWLGIYVGAWLGAPGSGEPPVEQPAIGSWLIRARRRGRR